MSLLFSITPIFLFVLVLIYLDTFKIIRTKIVIIFFILGILISGFAYFLNTFLDEQVGIPSILIIKYLAPIIEEILKFSIIIYLVRKSYAGFLSDIAIYGFIIGSGFAFSENLYYFVNSYQTNIMMGLIRGLGTALMHGSLIAFSGVLYLYLKEMTQNQSKLALIISVIPSIIMHILYNHFFLPPIIQTAILLVLFSISAFIMFSISENIIKSWINSELDEEIEVISLFDGGKISETNIGKYINKIKTRFDPFNVFDMLVLTKLNIELSMQLKVNMMLQMNAIEIPVDKEFEIKISDYKKLKKNIGKSGMMALNPILMKNNLDKWKANSLEQ